MYSYEFTCDEKSVVRMRLISNERKWTSQVGILTTEWVTLFSVLYVREHINNFWIERRTYDGERLVSVDVIDMMDIFNNHKAINIARYAICCESKLDWLTLEGFARLVLKNQVPYSKKEVRELHKKAMGKKERIESLKMENVIAPIQ